MPTDLDEIDRAILAILQIDGWIMNADLDRAVSPSPAATHARARRLERGGLIRSYAALVDPERDAVTRGPHSCRRDRAESLAGRPVLGRLMKIIVRLREAGAIRQLAVVLAVILVACSGASAAPRGASAPPPAAPVPAQSSPTPADVPSRWVAAPAGLPLRDGHVQMAVAPNGGLYVLITTGVYSATAASWSRSVLALLDSGGRPRVGWPQSISGWSCNPSSQGSGVWDPSPDVLVAPDGSVRVVCTADRWVRDTVHRSRVFAFDARGRALRGWPLDIDGSIANYEPRLVGDRFVTLVREYMQPAVATDPYPAAFWVQSIAADGTLTVGKRYEIPETAWLGSCRLGPDGVGYVPVEHGRTTEIAAIDLDGLRAGWPVTVPDVIYGLAFGQPGFVFVVSDAGGGTKTRARVLTSTGRVVPTAAVVLPIRALSAWDGAGPGEPATLVAADRTTWIFGTRGTRTFVYALDRAGRVRAGWPRDVTPGLVPLGGCSLGATGCGWWLSRPAFGPGDVLYFTRGAASGSVGGSIAALGPNGKARPGWPVILQRPGAGFEPIEVGKDGTVFAIANEPEARERTSATILAITPDGTVRWRTTVVEP